MFKNKAEITGVIDTDSFSYGQNILGNQILYFNLLVDACTVIKCQYTLDTIKKENFFKNKDFSNLYATIKGEFFGDRIAVDKITLRR